MNVKRDSQVSADPPIQSTHDPNCFIRKVNLLERKLRMVFKELEFPPIH